MKKTTLLRVLGAFPVTLLLTLVFTSPCYGILHDFSEKPTRYAITIPQLVLSDADQQPAPHNVVLAESCHRHRHAILHELHHVFSALNAAASSEDTYYTDALLPPIRFIQEESDQDKRTYIQGVFNSTLNQDVNIQCEFGSMSCENRIGYVTTKEKINLCRGFFDQEGGIDGTMDDNAQCDHCRGGGELKGFDTRARILLRLLFLTAPGLEMSDLLTGIDEAVIAASAKKEESGGLGSQDMWRNADIWAWVVTGIYWDEMCGYRPVVKDLGMGSKGKAGEGCWFWC